jgi:hypothetical protein
MSPDLLSSKFTITMDLPRFHHADPEMYPPPKGRPHALVVEYTKAEDLVKALVFLSYAREDSDFARRLAADLKTLAADLKTKGANVWLDQLDIQPGRPWDREVERALTICNEMLVILSPASVDSSNVMDEVAFALEERKRVIPVLRARRSQPNTSPRSRPRPPNLPRRHRNSPSPSTTRRSPISATVVPPRLPRNSARPPT